MNPKPSFQRTSERSQPSNEGATLNVGVSFGCRRAHLEDRLGAPAPAREPLASAVKDSAAIGNHILRSKSEMKDVAIFVKSHGPDLPLVHRLLDSMSRHNRDRISAFISVPVGDVGAFQDLSRRFNDVSVLADDHFGIPTIDRKIWGFAPGYISQQLVKLSVQRLSEARNYVMLDSDIYFIRDFTTKDFIAPDGTGLTVLAEDKDLAADPAWAPFAEARAKKIDLIADRLGAPTVSPASCFNNAIFQDSVLHDFHDWCRSESLSLLDLMAIAPVEFTWYNLFLVKHCPERLVKIEPFIRIFHTRNEYRRLVAAGFKHESLRRSYLGVCINSNWAGTRQGRYVSRLERGSRAAALMVKSDRARYDAAREFRLFLDAHLPGASRRLSRVPEQSS